MAKQYEFIHQNSVKQRSCEFSIPEMFSPLSLVVILSHSELFSLSPPPTWNGWNGGMRGGVVDDGDDVCSVMQSTHSAMIRGFYFQAL